MGCSPSLITNSSSNLDNTKIDHYKIVVFDSNGNQKQEYYYEHKSPSEFIMTIMNKICFDPQGKNPLDGNFISIYDEKDNRFHYFVHRLKGIEIENAKEPLKGKMWICYINRKKEDWDLLVENDVKITHKDLVEWKYERF